MRCKVSCTQKQIYNDGVCLYFSPVYTGSEENKMFFRYTSGGIVNFNFVNKDVADKFEIGKEYYVDFSPAL